MNYLIGVSFTSLFILGFFDNLRGPLFPEIIRHFQVNDTLGSAYFAVSSMLAFFASYLVRKKHDTYFMLQILNIGVLGIGLSFIVQVYAENYSILMLGVVFLGISFGLLGVSQNNLVVQGTDNKNRARMLSGLHSMYGISALIAPLYVAGLSEMGWKRILFFISFLPLGFFIIIYIMNLKVRQHLKDQVKSSQQSHEAHGISLSWKEKTVCFAIAFYVIAEIILGTRLALFMRRYFNYNLQDSSFYVTLMFILLLAGRLIVSFYPPKWPIKFQLISSLSISTILMLLGMYINPLYMVFCGFTMAPFYPLAISYISEVNPQKTTELVSTTIAFQSLFVVLMHFGVGRIADLAELKLAFWIGPLSMMISIALLLTVKKKIYE